MKKHLIVYLALLTTTLTFPKEQVVDQSLEVKNPGSIFIEVITGKINVKTHNKQTVNVTGTIGKNVKKLILKEDKSKITLKPDILEKHIKKQKKIECNLEIYIPEKISVHINSVSAPIQFNGQTKNLNTTSVSGDIIINSTSENMDIQTINGKVKVDGKSKILEGMSISGDYSLTGDFPFIKIKTSSGSITSKGEILKNATIFTTSGPVNIECIQLESSHIDINSVNSPIKLKIEKLENIAVTIKSIAGKISANKNNFDNSNEENRKLQLKKGTGESLVFIETITGNIEIKN